MGRRRGISDEAWKRAAAASRTASQAADDAAAEAARIAAAEQQRRAALFDRLLNALEAVKQACLYGEDDGTIGVTSEPHISPDLFDRICAVLTCAKTLGTKED